MAWTRSLFKSSIFIISTKLAGSELQEKPKNAKVQSREVRIVLVEIILNDNMICEDNELQFSQCK
jgi:hypothetical protein